MHSKLSGSSCGMADTQLLVDGSGIIRDKVVIDEKGDPTLCEYAPVVTSTLNSDCIWTIPYARALTRQKFQVHRKRARADAQDSPQPGAHSQNGDARSDADISTAAHRRAGFAIEGLGLNPKAKGLGLNPKAEGLGLDPKVALKTRISLAKETYPHANRDLSPRRLGDGTTVQ